MSGYRTIKRGPMAADQFTQIANAVFRDPRLSAKAMGVFGHLSTHREGYGITPERISQFMKDGVSAIKKALQELEACGYLYRDRERRADGTLGSATYYITDQPESLDDTLDPSAKAANPDARRPATRGRQTPRSQPEVGNPPVDFPPVENRTPKNTKEKKTNNKKTNPVPPAVPRARAKTTKTTKTTDRDGRKDGSQLPNGQPRSGQVAAIDSTPGVELLLQVGAEDPRYLLTGPALRDQGMAVSALLAAGWTVRQIRQVVIGRPLPEKITTSVGAIVAKRLSAALTTPTPHEGAVMGDESNSGIGDSGQTWTPPPVGEVLAAIPTHAECDGDDGLCGRPAEPGYDKCAACMGWVPRGNHRNEEGRVGA